MFSSELSPLLFEQAERNVEIAQSGMSLEEVQQQPSTQIPSSHRPNRVLLQAIIDSQLTLFACAGSNGRYCRLQPQVGRSVLAEMAYIEGRPASLDQQRARVLRRFQGSCPTTLLRQLGVDVNWPSSAAEFTPCFRRIDFDRWLAKSAKEFSWPLDRKKKRGRGQPSRIPDVKPIIKAVIHAGAWRPSMSLISLVAAVNASFGEKPVSRETIKRALEEVFEETGDPRFHYSSRRARPRE
jgi:hypothetical protein